MPSHDLLQQALRAQRSGDVSNAAVLLQRLLDDRPGDPEATLHLALLHAGQGRLTAARDLLAPLAARYPNVPAAVINHGEILRRLGEFDAAIPVLEGAVARMPDQPVARFNLALALRGAGRLDEALTHYAEALRRQPDHGDGWYNQGNAQLDAGLYDDARTSYQQALKHLPRARHAKVLNNLASAHILQRRPAQAARVLRDTLTLAPDYTDGHLNLAVAEERQGHTDAAASGYRRVARLRPEHWWHALHADTLCPDVFEDNAAIDAWREGFAATIERWRDRPGQLDLTLLENSGAEPPATLMYQGRDDRLLKSAYADMITPRLPAFEPPPPRAGGERRRIGMVVNHGHEGIFIRSLQGVLPRLDRRRFEIVVAVTRPALHQTRAALGDDGLTWLALSPRVDQAAEQLRAARLDLLYHWEVGSDSFNYFLPWLRPAPLQYTSWAWPLTTGLPAMDFFLSSELVETEHAQRRYREPLLTMPGNMFTWAEPPRLADRPPRRADFGLSANEHLYLCHQNPRKIHPDFDPLVAAILERDPAGRLLLIGSQEGAEAGPLRQRLQRRLGPLAERVSLLPRMDRQRYLGLVNQVDVALDPPHYTGANTSFDALGLAVPLITLPSTLLRGNFTSGLYRRMGLTGLIARDTGHYVDLAVSVATDPALRDHWHTLLREHNGAIFHDSRAITELQDAWDIMLRAH
ncbi:tetratricopeptide repeat protein [Alcanivorax marinus]|uniref:protein O-GlcNAc transferase n=1 Tax=Alloalcanivorax marinus TaxID=1177169 RepID=A0A9Q3UKG1_9GAMM|nr:tetratricopeptide repeat protein [Alloalcanivorax marinus]MCC4307676.1 tetratricopeptide repeat protein [Alloalcanivorax marinus]